MIRYTTAVEAIAGMHECGFSNDFQLSGNDLLWVQQKVFIHMGEFAILEYHRLWYLSAGKSDLSLFGIMATYHNVRGILIINHTLGGAGHPPVILKKMNELNQKILYRANIENGNV